MRLLLWLDEYTSLGQMDTEGWKIVKIIPFLLLLFPFIVLGLIIRLLRGIL